MLFLADQMVPNELVAFLRRRPHEVHLVRELLSANASDLTIARLAHQLGAVVITWNVKHFTKFICRSPRGENIRFPKAGLLGFTCMEARAVRRLRHVIDLVEFELGRCSTLPDRRFFATVTSETLAIER